MYMKKCTSCGEHSYSASRFGRWRCSRCDRDLTNTETHLAHREKRRKNEKTA